VVTSPCWLLDSLLAIGFHLNSAWILPLDSAILSLFMLFGFASVFPACFTCVYVCLASPACLFSAVPAAGDLCVQLQVTTSLLQLLVSLLTHVFFMCVSWSWCFANMSVCTDHVLPFALFCCYLLAGHLPPSHCCSAAAGHLHS
jgi:hypothetical protein